MSFKIDTSSPTGGSSSAGGIPLPSVTASSTCIVVSATDTVSGIGAISFSGPSVSTTTTPFSCPATATVGPFCNLSAGNYTETWQNCALTSTTYTQQLTAGTLSMSICADQTCSNPSTVTSSQLNSNADNMFVSVETDPPQSFYPDGCTSIFSSLGTTCTGTCVSPQATCTFNCECGTVHCSAGACSYGYTLGPYPATGLTYTVSKTRSYSLDMGVTFGVSLSSGSGQVAGAGVDLPHYTGNSTITVTVSEAGQQRYTVKNTTGTEVVTNKTPIKVVKTDCTQQITFLEYLALLAYNLFASSPLPCVAYGSDFVLTSSATITFNYVLPANVATDTTTLAIYRYDGVAWSSAGVTNQSLSIVGSSVTISGYYVKSGTFTVAFTMHDSSAPVTTFSIQGSSFAFDGTMFVSTWSYAVLTATDPAVNGYASQVSTTFYRLDASTPTAPYAVYASSFPLALGPHVLQYYSRDYAGNNETVNTSTFIVTAGTVFKESANFLAAGKFLDGFLNYGFQMEVQSQAQNSYTLLVSSPDTSAMLSVTNIGSVGVGTSNPQANADVQGTASGNGDIALELRSGNSTTTLSEQVTFGYNGDIAMRHAIETQHSTNTIGNRMDFLVWNPGAGSTSTVASLDVVSLQQSTLSASGVSVHIHPTATIGDAELLVSNGVQTGGGTLHRAAAGTYSSLALKSDIAYLKEKDEERAYQDVLGLKHARYRYKGRDPAGRLVRDERQPLLPGLIYEDSPASIQGPRKTVVIDERVINVEMALKQAMKKLEKLQKRLKELEAQK